MATRAAKKEELPHRLEFITHHPLHMSIVETLTSSKDTEDVFKINLMPREIDLMRFGVV